MYNKIKQVKTYDIDCRLKMLKYGSNKRYWTRIVCGCQGTIVVAESEPCFLGDEGQYKGGFDKEI